MWRHFFKEETAPETLARLLMAFTATLLILISFSCQSTGDSPKTQVGDEAAINSTQATTDSPKSQVDDETTNNSTQSNGDLPEIQASDEAAIYSAVIRQLATVDDTFGGNLNPTTLYIIGRTDDSVGDPGEDIEMPSLIADTMRNEISAALANLGAEIIWIEKFKDAGFESSGVDVKHGGAIFTLGNIHMQTDGSVKVSGSIYIASLAAGGTTYILKKQDGVWQITGTTGARWIS